MFADDLLVALGLPLIDKGWPGLAHSRLYQVNSHPTCSPFFQITDKGWALLTFCEEKHEPSGAISRTLVGYDWSLAGTTAFLRTLLGVKSTDFLYLEERH